MPPVLLADARWYGTLAAVRDLGSRGVPVIVGYDAPTAPARWSRYVSAAVPCPSSRDADQFIAWLHEFGERHPGCVLCATSDDVAFMIASHYDTLSRLFYLFSPPVEALLGVLDKSRLASAARCAGLASPETWSPADEAELQLIADELPLPLLVKPRTQILLRKPNKGLLVERREDVVPSWRKIQAAVSCHPWVLAAAPGLGSPILQRHHDLSERIYTVDGFADANGAIVEALASDMTLQFPRRSGPGVCFEPAALDANVLAGLERLCRNTGHIGVFDAEFVIDGDKKLLIDFNPRFYHHMAFELDRGLELPWLGYVSALGRGDDAEQRPGISFGASEGPAHGKTALSRGIYVQRLTFTLLLAAQCSSGRMGIQEGRAWLRWMVDSRGRLTDPAYRYGDRVPAYFELIQRLRHPRALLRAATR